MPKTCTSHYKYVVVIIIGECNFRQMRSKDKIAKQFTTDKHWFQLAISY